MNAPRACARVNSNGEVHGYYSRRRRELTPEAAEIADELMTLPHVTAADRLAAEEIGCLLVMIDRIDAALANGKVFSGLLDRLSIANSREEAVARCRGPWGPPSP